MQMQVVVFSVCAEYRGQSENETLLYEKETAQL